MNIPTAKSNSFPAPYGRLAGLCSCTLYIIFHFGKIKKGKSEYLGGYYFTSSTEGLLVYIPLDVLNAVPHKLRYILPAFTKQIALLQ